MNLHGAKILSWCKDRAIVIDILITGVQAAIAIALRCSKRALSDLKKDPSPGVPIRSYK